jgi:hypothetical protein
VEGVLTITNGIIRNNTATGGEADGGGACDALVNTTTPQLKRAGKLHRPSALSRLAIPVRSACCRQRCRQILFLPHAIGGGGGICNANGGSLKVSNSILSGNAVAEGGGIFSTGTATVSDSTFSGNSGGGG